jgi:beta-lactamase regulating signal transducer with metallopeptidase domain
MNAALLLTAIFNGAWQGAAICTLALLAFRLFRRLNATTMFAVWSVLLAIAVLLPFANYAFATKPYVVHVSAPRYLGRPSIPQGDTRVPQRDTKRDTGAVRVAVRPRYLGRASMPQHATSVPQGDTRASTPLHDAIPALISTILRYAWAILALLALIALLRLTVLVHDVVRMLLARKRVRPIDLPVNVPGAIGRPFSYAASDEFTSPCVLGFAPALIVLPEDLLAAQDGAELTSVVLHEREHVRRFDDVQNVLHRFVGAIAYFCPGVRIALRELALYREQICDDAAINATGDRVSYAMTLTDLSQWAQGRGAPVPSLIFKRKQLLHRLEVLLDSAVSHSLRMNRRFAFGAVTALVLAAALVLRIQVPVIAQTVVPSAPEPLAQKVRAQLSKVHTQVQQMHAQMKLLHVQTKLLREQAQQAHAQAQQVHAQVVKMHTELKKVRPALMASPEPAPSPEAKPAPLLAPPHAHAHLHALLRAKVVSMVPLPANANTTPVQPAMPTTMASVNSNGSGDLLDALDQAGMRNLSVDELIALRDHGVSADLVRDAASYFGRLSARDLVYLADHGVGPNYIGTLRASGVRGISVEDAVKLMDHGVSAPLIAAATAYFGHPSAEDLTTLADHGVSAPTLQGFRSAGLSGVSLHDIVRLADNGVDPRYVVKVRRFNPRASVDDIIRLRDAGF